MKSHCGKTGGGKGDKNGILCSGGGNVTIQFYLNVAIFKCIMLVAKMQLVTTFWYQTFPKSLKFSFTIKFFKIITKIFEKLRIFQNLGGGKASDDGTQKKRGPF